MIPIGQRRHEIPWGALDCAEGRAVTDTVGSYPGDNCASRSSPLSLQLLLAKALSHQPWQQSSRELYLHVEQVELHRIS